MLSRFAIGAVAAAAHTGPKRIVEGAQPRQGVRLRLEEPVAFVSVLAVGAGLQLGLLVLAATLVWGVEGDGEDSEGEREGGGIGGLI